MYQAIRNSQKRRQSKQQKAQAARCGHSWGAILRCCRLIYSPPSLRSMLKLSAHAVASGSTVTTVELEPTIERYKERHTVVVKSHEGRWGFTLRGAIYIHEPTGIYVASVDKTDGGLANALQRLVQSSAAALDFSLLFLSRTTTPANRAAR